MIVEHSAILISKILKAFHRHFNFDGWYEPVPPTVMSQQWPAPAAPLRGEMKVGKILHSLCSCLRISEDSSPTTQTNKEVAALSSNILVITLVISDE